MILLQILDHDLHRSRNGEKVVPCIENPSKPNWVPAIVSTSRGKFVSADKLYSFGEFQYRFTHPGRPFPPTSDDRKYVISGVFQYDPDMTDDLIPDIFDAALNLSETSKWPNIFTGKGMAGRAFGYIQKHGLPGFPHVCLIPRDWSDKDNSKFFGANTIVNSKYREFCRVIPCKIKFPVFLSRPDMVGRYTQFLGGNSSIFLHNVKLGMSFCT